MVLMVLLSIVLTIIVVMQEGNSNNNLGAIAGGTESFFGKNKTKSLDAKLKRLTIYLAISILITSILFFVVRILLNTLD